MNSKKLPVAGALMAGALLLCVLPGRAQPPFSETVLHNFTNTPDGRLPTAGLTLGSDGALYGVTGFPALGVLIETRAIE